jgi:biotin carboxylase
VNVLILNRSPLAERDFPSWVGAGHRLYLVTDAAAVSTDPATRAAQLGGYEHVEVVDAYHANAAVEHLVVRLHERYRFDLLIGLAEFDIVRSARLRGILGIPGQDVESATAFRDKRAMKEILHRAGVPVAPFVPVADFADLYGFIRAYGYPVVVKPRTGGGSMGVHVLRTEADLLGYLERSTDLGGDDGAHLLAEVYVEHELYHVDGIVVDGECRLVWPSTHGDTGCLDPMEGKALTASFLEPTEPVFAPVVELTTRALESLPTPETYIFHAEVFGTADRGLLFNEVASRMGGGMIEATLELGFGVRLPEVYVRSLVGNRPPPIARAPRTVAGYAQIPPRAGTLVGVPEHCPVEGIVQYRSYVEPGTTMKRAELSRDKLASLLATGPSRAAVERALRAGVSWFEDLVELQ